MTGRGGGTSETDAIRAHVTGMIEAALRRKSQGPGSALADTATHARMIGRLINLAVARVPNPEKPRTRDGIMKAIGAVFKEVSDAINRESIDEFRRSLNLSIRIQPLPGEQIDGTRHVLAILRASALRRSGVESGSADADTAQDVRMIVLRIKQLAANDPLTENSGAREYYVAYARRKIVKVSNEIMTECLDQVQREVNPGIRHRAVHELTREQADIIDAAIGKRLLVTGPPGTGKTLLAINIAERLARAGKKSLLITKGKVLTTYVSMDLENRGLSGDWATTFDKWAGKWHWRLFRSNLPTIAAVGFNYDWMNVIPRIVALPDRRVVAGDRHLLIDEGQDFPELFYRLLYFIKDTDITVFADENQRIANTHSTIEQIKNGLFLNVDEHRKLTQNYRNTRPIAEVAARLQPGSRAFPPAPGCVRNITHLARSWISVRL